LEHVGWEREELGVIWDPKLSTAQQSRSNWEFETKPNTVFNQMIHKS
jgi:hypothetical protein